jgi:hypothetical protein
MRNYARRRTKAMAIANLQAYYDEECEYCYREEQEQYEEQYDDEQCAYYHHNYIEEVLNDIRKRLYQRSQPSRQGTIMSPVFPKKKTQNLRFRVFFRTLLPGQQDTADGRRKCSYARAAKSL